MNREIYELTYRAEESHFWYVGRRRVLDSWLQRALATAALPQTGLRLLDYGCGTGMNLLYFQRFGAVTGVDAAPEALALCRRRGLTNLIDIDSFEELASTPALAAAFHVITMLDVLEHIPDDAATLRRMRGFLKPGGRLVITVPAYAWLWSGEDVVSKHVRRYTASSLSRTVSEAGYEIVDQSHFNTLLLPLQAAAVFWQRATGQVSQPQTLVKPLPRLLNRALAGAIGLEALLLRKGSMPLGASLICTARTREDS